MVRRVAVALIVALATTALTVVLDDERCRVVLPRKPEQRTDDVPDRRQHGISGNCCFPLLEPCAIVGEKFSQRPRVTDTNRTDANVPVL